jgi:aminoglycoside phosphotransferase (APT) family kinase protein
MDTECRLVFWLAEQLPDARDVRIDGLDRVTMGHSAETLLLCLIWADSSGEHREDICVRLRPPAPGLLEPYDLQRQFDVLRGLELTPVRSPKDYWLESSGAILGQGFYVIEVLPGTVYERVVPDEVAADPERIRRMCEGIVEQIAAIHTVDLQSTGLDAIADGHDYLRRELERWSGEIRRVQRGPQPALERLVEVITKAQPEQSETLTLVHGDPKPGNFVCEGSDISAVFDWEMTTIGDPMADIGWAEVVWTMGSFTSLPGALTTDQAVARWTELTGIEIHDRPWYRALQALKMAVILLVGGQLFDSRASEDLRMMEMPYAIDPLTRVGLRELGINEALPSGPVSPRKERMLEVEAAVNL